MQIGKPLQTIVVEPLELPVEQPTREPEPEPIQSPEPEPKQVPVKRVVGALSMAGVLKARLTVLSDGSS